MADQTPYDRAFAAATYIRAKLPKALQHPKIAIVCGSGLSGLQSSVDDASRIEVPYSDIPNFPQPTVEGHEGKLVFGVMGATKVPLMLFVGRVHFYEGRSIEEVTFAARLCRAFDAGTFIATNAAGGLHPRFNVGDIMLLNDHINMPGLAGNHPLLGPNEAKIGPRFTPLSDTYDLDLRRRAFRVWQRLFATSKREMHEGVYVMVSGPTYETRAEARFLALQGDAVGMSTVPEVVVARHAGLRVLAASLITNKVLLHHERPANDPMLQKMSREELDKMMSQGRANHDEVVQEGARAAQALIALVKGVVEDLIADGSV